MNKKCNESFRSFKGKFFGSTQLYKFLIFTCTLPVACDCDFFSSRSVLVSQVQLSILPINQ